MFKRLFSSRYWLVACTVATALIFAFLAAVSPQQIPGVVYKTGLVLFAGLVGHWLDRAFSPTPIRRDTLRATGSKSPTPTAALTASTMKFARDTSARSPWPPSGAGLWWVWWFSACVWGCDHAY